MAHRKTPRNTTCGNGLLQITLTPLWSRNGRVLLDAIRLAHLADRTPLDFGIILCELLLILFALLKEPDLHGSLDAKPE